MKDFKTLVEVGKELLEELKELKGEFDYNCIRIWPADKAPKSLKKLESDDVDWYALVPDHIYHNYYLTFLDVPGFGCAHIDDYPIPGFIVVIGCHA